MIYIFLVEIIFKIWIYFIMFFVWKNIYVVFKMRLLKKVRNYKLNKKKWYEDRYNVIL